MLAFRPGHRSRTRLLEYTLAPFMVRQAQHERRRARAELVEGLTTNGDTYASSDPLALSLSKGACRGANRAFFNSIVYYLQIRKLAQGLTNRV